MHLNADPFTVCNPRYGASISNMDTADSETAIDCLAKHSYQEAKCKAEIDSLYECCNKFYQRKGDAAKTLSCPKAGLLRLKMEQRKLD